MAMVPYGCQSCRRADSDQTQIIVRIDSERSQIRLSSCVLFQGVLAWIFGCHSVLFLTRVLRMTRSLRMQAVRTTLNGLPRLVRRSAKARMTGLQRRAEKAAMYKTARTVLRPPQMQRR